MNHAIEWIKSHPTESLLAAGAVGGLVWLMTRSSGSSASNAVSGYYGAQLQMAQINAQNAAQQAQIQGQQNVAAYAAQVQNNQTAAALAATAEQYKAGIQTAQIAADVQNQQTQAGESVANTQTNAELAALESQLNAQTTVAGLTANYATTVANNQADIAKQYLNNTYNLQNTILPYVNTFNGSQNRLAFLQSVLGQSNAASATESSYAAVNNPAYNPLNSLLGGLGQGAGSFLSSLFG